GPPNLKFAHSRRQKGTSLKRIHTRHVGGPAVIVPPGPIRVAVGPSRKSEPVAPDDPCSTAVAAARISSNFMPNFPPENGCDRNDSWKEIGSPTSLAKTALLLLPFCCSCSSDERASYLLRESSRPELNFGLIGKLVRTGFDQLFCQLGGACKHNFVAAV